MTRASYGWLVLFCLIPVTSFSAEDGVSKTMLTDVQKRVKAGFDRFSRLQSNCAFKVNGNDAHKVKFAGACRIMRQSILVEREPGFKGERLGVRGFNGQYGFWIAQNQDKNWTLNRLDLEKNKATQVIRLTLLGDIMGWTNAYSVYDVPLTEIVNEREGKILELRQTEKSFVFDFRFRQDHPYGHSSAHVELDLIQCCILNYELIDGAKEPSLIESRYSVQLEYRPISAEDKFLVPSKYTYKARGFEQNQMKFETAQLETLISDIEIGKCNAKQFTLSSYEIPEPAGTTVLHGPVPTWTIWAVAGFLLLSLGLWLRRRSSRQH